MSVTEIPSTQDQEPDGFTQTLTNPQKGTVTNSVVQEATADLPADCTTPHDVTEGVNRGPVAVRPVTGSLTITPDQTTLTPEQKAAFQSLGIDPNDPVARAHVRRFLHTCQIWGVDPFAGEIHLVQRGKPPQKPGEKDTRTWTIQVALNGYRRRAREVSASDASRLRWIGKARWYWTGGDDDPNGFRPVEDPKTGDIIMRAVWWEVWPDNRPAPAAAKAVIDVEDKVTGERWTEEFVAHWEMFAAYEQVWENNRKVFKDGKPVLKLGTFWEKGKAHMLAKCAETSVLRAVFHGAYNHPEHGTVYSAEEMSRADADAARQLEDAVAERRREAYRKAQEYAENAITASGASGTAADAIRQAARDFADASAPPSVIVSTVVGATETDDTTGATGAATDAPAGAPTAAQADAQPDPGADAGPEPARLSDVLPQAVQLTEEERRMLLREEIKWIGEELNERLDVKIATRARKTFTDINSAELLRTLGPLRELTIIPHLRQTDRAHMADSYAKWGPNFVGTVDVLCGLADPADMTDVVRQTMTALDRQQAPHPFDPRQDDDSRCTRCNGYEDDEVHGGQMPDPAE